LFYGSREAAQRLIKRRTFWHAENPGNIRRGKGAVGRDRHNGDERLYRNLLGQMAGRPIQRNQCDDVFLIDGLHKIG
jgi:hypothetical protein